jgi:hypothetical protein
MLTDKGLASLHELEQLVKLSIAGTKVSPEAVAELERALPYLNIVGKPW